MSLTVSPDLLARAEQGEVDDAEFVRCIRESLPYAYELVWILCGRLQAGDTAAGIKFADNLVEPPDEQARGQLLRAMASDAIRAALERHFGVRLAFQNCHRVAAFPVDGSADEQLARFSSVRAQLLNQSPEFVNC
ncbi:MAG TPA: SCO5389 family protein [Cryptosporangiaceae bacterium]|nr:SCO5389 family protein [Cryptosporangiaceae bacterium]